MALGGWVPHLRDKHVHLVIIEQAVFYTYLELFKWFHVPLLQRCSCGEVGITNWLLCFQLSTGARTTD